LRAAQAGNRAAFDQLVRGSFAAIYSRIFHLIGNHEDAEDLTQDCFVRAYRALGTYRGDAPFLAWLSRIALYRTRDFQRSQRQPSVELERAVGAALPAWRGPAEEASRGELSTRVAAAIEALPTRLREAFCLRVLEGLDYGDVAQIVGLRSATVRTQVMKARRELARTLAPYLERKPS